MAHANPLTDAYLDSIGTWLKSPMAIAKNFAALVARQKGPTDNFVPHEAKLEEFPTFPDIINCGSTPGRCLNLNVWAMINCNGVHCQCLDKTEFDTTIQGLQTNLAGMHNFSMTTPLAPQMQYKASHSMAGQ